MATEYFTQQIANHFYAILTVNMQYKTHQSFASLLTKAPDLCRLTAKLTALDQLSQAVASNLDSSLANNCRVSNLRDGTLSLSTNSPAWNHKLRFCSLDLLSALRADPRWSGLKSIEVRVDYIPQMDVSQSTGKSKLKPISQSNAKLINQIADNISSTALATALKKLAMRSKQSKDVGTL